MPERFWMVTNRGVRNGSLTNDEDRLRFFTAPPSANPSTFAAWTERSRHQFVSDITAHADTFPSILDPDRHEQQKHLSLFIHGYNNDWRDAAKRYKQIAEDVFLGSRGLGICVLFSWPSDGSKLGYYPDRLDARRSADDLAEVLSTLYDALLARQTLAMTRNRAQCRAKISVIAHSMGNYVLQQALYHVWTRKNRPLLTSLVNQLVMVAADVDNDLFSSGETVSEREGEGIANLTYRAIALYTGHDKTLGLSAGIKHFGKRPSKRRGSTGWRPRRTTYGASIARSSFMTRPTCIQPTSRRQKQ
jgi:esterase/lipase superfamily enzyme